MFLWLAMSCKSPGLTELPPPGTQLDDTAPATDDSAPDDTSPDSDSDPGGNNAPVVNTFTADAREGQIRLMFDVTDADKDLTGGNATLTALGNTETYAWPDDLAFNADGIPAVYWSLGTLPADSEVSVILKVTDRAGNTSAPKSAPYEHATTYERVSETGDTQGTATNLGQLTPPIEIIGDLYGTGNNGSKHTSDNDWVRFAVPADMTVKINLTWDEATADYDVYLWDAGNNMYAWSDTSSQPEVFDAELNAGENYTLQVAGWTGASGDWKLVVAPL